jgi:predicted nucleic acid-binding protein
MATDKKYKLYWETSAWVGWGNDQHHTRSLCTQLLREAVFGNFEIALSTLAIAEFAPLSQEQEKALDMYLKKSSFIVISLNRSIAKLARELRGKYQDQGLKGVDAVHLASAIEVKADYLHTYNQHLLQLSPSVSEIIITQPDWPKQGKLDMDIPN